MWRPTLACLILTLALPAVAGQVAPQPQAADPDHLYAAREVLPRAFEAAALWEQRLTSNPADFESAWKLARACYWLGGHVAPNERRAQYERGITAGRRAVALSGARPEGHFWTAANMGAMAESFGLIAGIKYKGPVKAELETVLTLDRAYQQGSADRALGRWYMRVPGLFGGSDQKSVMHLKQSLTYDPDSAASHFFLAETYLKMKRRAEARDELRRTIDAPLLDGWEPEVREFRAKAAALLATLN